MGRQLPRIALITMLPRARAYLANRIGAFSASSIRSTSDIFTGKRPFMILRHLILALSLLFASCATDYQPQGFTGGYSDYLTAPDEAVITFHGNGYTAPERVGQMAALRCAEVTLEHSYRYFIIIGASDLSGTTSFTTPGYAHTYGSAFATGNFATG